MRILFEDNHCLAVAKPAGLLTQAPAGVPSAERWAKEHIRTKFGKTGNVYLGVPHRLDRPVSGVLLFARSGKAARRLAEQFRDRVVVKTYWGLVEGELNEAEGEWRDWLRKVPNESRAEIVAEDAEGAKLAAMRFRLLNVGDGCAMVEFRPETGRMHQIRIQSASRGHPLLGDALYGSKVAFGPTADEPRDRIIALHARSLLFLHPISYEPMTLDAPLGEDWATRWNP